MPKVDGIEVLREVRNDEYLRRIPVIVLTTSQQDSDIVESYDLGTNAYIVKPGTPNEYMKILQSISHFWFELVVLPPKVA